LKDNTPCGPLNKTPTTFKWMPNDKNMSWNVQFFDRYTLLTKLELEWWKPPAIFKVACFSDVMNIY